jgi:hypothetical protein
MWKTLCFCDLYTSTDIFYFLTHINLLCFSTFLSNFAELLHIKSVFIANPFFIVE